MKVLMFPSVVLVVFEQGVFALIAAIITTNILSNNVKVLQ